MPAGVIEALIGGVIAAFIGQVFQFWHTRQAYERQLKLAEQAHRHEKALARDADERKLRDARLERLQEAYVTVANAALKVWSAGHLMFPLVFDDETVGDARQRWAELRALSQRQKMEALTESLQVALIILRSRSQSLTIVDLGRLFGAAAAKYQALVMRYERRRHFSSRRDLLSAAKGALSSHQAPPAVSRAELLIAYQEMDRAYDKLVEGIRASLDAEEVSL